MAKWFGVMTANESLATCMRLNGHYGWAKDLPLEHDGALKPATAEEIDRFIKHEGRVVRSR